MDPGTLIGIGLAFAAVFGSMIMEGGNPAAILLPPAMVLVFVGTFGVAMACGLLKDATGALAALKTRAAGQEALGRRDGRRRWCRSPNGPAAKACWRWRRWPSRSTTRS